MLGLLKHVPCRARLVIAPLAEAACAREFSPVETETVEPLTAEMVVDVLDLVSIRDDCQIAALSSGLPVSAEVKWRMLSPFFWVKVWIPLSQP